MPQSFKPTRNLQFEDHPNPQNQPCLSPASSSNEPIPINPLVATANTMLNIYMPNFGDTYSSPRQRTNAGHGSSASRPPQHVQTAVVNYDSPPRALYKPRTGPNVSLTAHLPTVKVDIEWDSDEEVLSTGNCHEITGTPQSRACSSVGDVPSQLPLVEGGPTTLPSSRSIKPPVEYIDDRIIRCLNKKKGKYPPNNSY